MSEETLPTAMVCLPCEPSILDGLAIEEVINADANKKRKKFACDQCKEACTTPFALKRHKTTQHSDERPFACDFPGCTKTFARKDKLAQHVKNKHSEDRPFLCGYPGCGLAFKWAGQRKEHWLRHSGEKPFPCGHPGCERAFRQKGTLTQHVAFKHSDERPFKCDRPGCEEAFKQASDLKQHKAEAHDIDVVPHECKLCGYKCKRETTLRVHFFTQHSEAHKQRKKKQEERVRNALLAADWQEWDRTEEMPPVGFFRREKRIDFKCAKLKDAPEYARIDFVLGVPGGFVFLEVDEDQHKHKHVDDPICDMKRMKNVDLALEARADKIGSNAPNVYWLRYNPHAWHVGGKTLRYEKVDREANLVAWLNKKECDAPLGIGYAFYDCEAPDEDGARGALHRLGTPEYEDKYAEVAENLMDLTLT